MNPTQRCDAAFKHAVLLQCYEALAAAGFTRFRKEAVDWPLEAEFHCWVGLNTALYATYVGISPFIGLHVVPLEKLWTRLKTGKYPAKYDRAVATIAIQLSELAPDERAFHFSTDMDIATEARRLAALYVRAGLPYAEGIASYRALLPMLKDRVGKLGGYPERFACCLYLMGHRDAAKQFVEGFVPDHRDYFEGFALPFISMLERERL